MRDLYRKRARHYDLAVWTYRLLGLREKMYRRHAVTALALRPGDTVVDLACGTGLNFQFLQPFITDEGRIVAVDLTDAMLDAARKRVESAGWRNIEFVQADMAEYKFPAGIAGVLSTFAISLVRSFDQVIRRAATGLQPDGRMAIFDLRACLNINRHEQHVHSSFHMKTLPGIIGEEPTHTYSYQAGGKSVSQKEALYQ